MLQGKNCQTLQKGEVVSVDSNHLKKELNLTSFAKLCVPTTNVKTGNFNKDIQVMHGVTKDEALLLVTSLILDPSSYDTFKNNWNIVGPALILDTLGSQVFFRNYKIYFSKN